METKISKYKFKAKALEICRRVERTGEPVVITNRGTPSLILQKHVAVVKNPLERLKKSVIRYDDPTVPVAENDWRAPE